jgi:hypothetical protein
VAEDQGFRTPKFVVRQTADGNGWRVLCEIGYRKPIEVDVFSSEQAARYWIETVSSSWLENRKRMSLI